MEFLSLAYNEENLYYIKIFINFFQFFEILKDGVGVDSVEYHLVSNSSFRRISGRRILRRMVHPHPPHHGLRRRADGECRVVPGHSAIDPEGVI